MGFLIPIQLPRPAATLEASGRSPMLGARRANPARIECVRDARSHKPSGRPCGRPSAERAPDAWAGGFVALFLIGLAIHNYGLVIFNGGHPRLPRSRATAAASKLCSGI